MESKINKTKALPLRHTSQQLDASAVKALDDDIDDDAAVVVDNLIGGCRSSLCAPIQLLIGRARTEVWCRKRHRSVLHLA